MTEREQTIPGVSAGGDIANDAGTVIAAMGNAKRAARAIHTYLTTRTGTGNASLSIPPTDAAP